MDSKKVNVTQEEEERIVHILKTTDASTEAVARRFGRTDTTIQRICRKHNARPARIRRVQGVHVETLPIEKKSSKRYIPPTEVKGGFL